ncbi:MAG TPA: NAD(P)-binding oxidoreductase [Polyangia bacterium]
MRLLILGATGKTGAELVPQALARGHAITALVRSPDKLKTHENLNIVQGDATNGDDLARALAGQEAVVSMLGASSAAGAGIIEAGARATLEAMRRTGVRRLVIVSMALMFPNVGFMGPILRLFLRHYLRDTAAMEALVRPSDLDWTIVRPPRLTMKPGRGAYRISEAGPPSFSVARADLARALVDVVERRDEVRKIVAVAT